MSDTKTGDDKTLSVTSKPTLTLKRPGLEHSTVKQNFSHGRSKSVVVETKKRKFSLPGDKPEPGAGIFKPAPAPQPAPRPIPVMPERAPRPAVPHNPPAAPAPKPAAEPVAAAPAPEPAPRAPSAAPARPQSSAPAAAPARPASRPINHGMVLNVLSNDEMAARRRALESAGFRNDDERRTAVEEARRRAQEEGLRKREAEESARRQAEEETRLRTEAEAKRRAEDEARRRTPSADIDASEPARPGFRRGPAAVDSDDFRSGRAGGGPRGAGGFSSSRAAPKAEVRVPKTRVIEPDNRHRLTVVSATAGEEGDSRGRSMAATRRRQEKFRRAQMQETREKVAREVILPETISIQELAQRMSERAVDVIKYLMKQGQMMTPGDIIDADLAELLAGEFGHTVKRVADSDVEEGFFNVTDIAGDLQPRAPVVTIMGHVDHGKTSLLDAIRKTNVVSGEAGGITQHIGAYQIERNGNKITFIDTPGHAAFTAMRARGAQATDIAILVVAADDAVMPQTIESINHAKAAKVPMIVAINKVDKHDADAQKVRTGLLQHEVFVESLGGETLDVEVSAKTGQGLDKLLEAILLQSEVLELKANPNRPAEGVVVEAKLDRGRGSVATVLIQAGTLKIGDIIVAGSEWGRVRALVTDKGEQVKEALPSMPIEILGLQGTPQAGDRIAVIDSEARAREISEYRQHKAREKAVAKQAGSRGSLEQMMTQLSTAGTKEFPLLIKGDVQGSIEAIAGALDKISTEEVRARIIHSGAGAITESDVSLAAASNAAIIGFNVRANTQARDAAAREGIEIRYYNIIYDLTDDVKAAMSGLLSPERRETFLGNAEILEVFNITKVGKVAGCRVTEGKVERGAGVRLLRDNVVIHEGKLKTLKRFKDEVGEVQTGQECGMAFENYEDIRQGDIIECFRVEEVKRSL
jgi:translation initiation factor IF-2